MSSDDLFRRTDVRFHYGRRSVNAGPKVTRTVRSRGLRSDSAVPVHEGRQQNTNSGDRSVKRCRIELSEAGDERAVDAAGTQMGGGAMGGESARSRFSCVFDNRLCAGSGREDERAEASPKYAQRDHLTTPYG
jgi:hypothetical protein